MKIPENLKSTRNLGLMAVVNRAADDEDEREFTVTLWLTGGVKYEGFRVKVPEGGYTLQDTVIEEHDRGYGHAAFNWSDISGIVVNWKNS